MEVLLVKGANYEFNEGKFTAIPSEVFTTLVGECRNTLEDTRQPRVIMFESKDDYLDNGLRHNIDYSKSIYVNQKGQIFCFLEENGTTDTQKD